ncbi:unnamed protein product, partial [Schistosoma turkestanicum]
APKMSHFQTKFDDEKVARITWELQDYDNCKDKELVFFLFGKPTIMQMAKGQEIRIPFLTPGEEYTVYAFPKVVDPKFRVMTNVGFNITV